jgi:hypothetical protein
VEVKTWQGFYAMFLPERSKFGLNELLGRPGIGAGPLHSLTCNTNDIAEGLANPVNNVSNMLQLAPLDAGELHAV